MAVESPSRFQPTFDHHRRTTREREKERNFSRLAGGRSIRRYYSKKRRISLSLLSSQERDKCIYSAGPFKPYYSQDQISTRGASLTNVLRKNYTAPPFHPSSIFGQCLCIFRDPSHSFIFAREISIAYSTADSFIGFFARFDLSLIVAGGDNDAC